MPDSHTDRLAPRAEKQRASVPPAGAPSLASSDEDDERVERMSMDSFPASDPPASTLTISTQGPAPPVRP